jgi:hypothetical protein
MVFFGYDAMRLIFPNFELRECSLEKVVKM